MPLETDGFDAFMNDIGRMSQAMDANDTGAPTARRILQDAAQPIHTQMKQNASSDPKIITGDLHTTILIGKVKKRRYSGQTITIGVHHGRWKGVCPVQQIPRLRPRCRRQPCGKP